ncbi:MAG: autoantigen p27 domain-containing protein [Candidatus Methanoperedens sp.]|jgi:UPF0148 protein|nr:autoantigen p27 domain-containing protein [Candidatus Methanoperedens sp.]PKL54692.1 MAG: hypothetical protein CVV36_00345 [Candidatus Methanoperedenaceae archaeon HGW-Methanoperedenaceae-1]
MSGIDENQKIQKITDLLVKGGTMLANHHDCGAPMFRYKGKIICPVCDIGGENTGSTGMPGKVNTGLPAKDEAAKDEAAKDEAAKDEAAKDEAAKDEAAANIRAEQEIVGKKSPPSGGVGPDEKIQSRTASTQSYMEIENQVRNKVHILAKTLEDETDLQRLRDKMECIELGIRILKTLKN